MTKEGEFDLAVKVHQETTICEAFRGSKIFFYLFREIPLNFPYNFVSATFSKNL